MFRWNALKCRSFLKQLKWNIHLIGDISRHERPSKRVAERGGRGENRRGRSSLEFMSQITDDMQFGVYQRLQ